MDDDDLKAGEAAAAVPPVPPRRRHRVRRWLVGSLLTLIVLLAGLVALLWWALKDPGGARWAAGWVPRTTIVGPSGSLLGDFSAERIDIDLGGAGTLRIEAPRWHALDARRGSAGRWLALRIDTLHANRVVLLPATRRPAGGGAPASAPTSLRLPLEIEIREASIDELRFGSAPSSTALFDLRGRIHLGADAGGVHRFDDMAARYDRARAFGRGSIDTDTPFAVEARLGLVATDPQLAWQAGAAAQGPLAALSTAIIVRLPASSGHAAQTLDAQAMVRPFAAWPLGDLDLATQGLDLSAFAGGLPATALSGRAHARTSGLDRPAAVAVELVNARAGRWNEGLLPMQRLTADLRARPDDTSVLEITRLEGELGSARLPGGHITGIGRWAAGEWKMAAQLAAVRPAALDARAPETSLDGTAAFVGHGFAAGGERSVDIEATLAGPLREHGLPAGAPRIARLHVEGRASEREIELRVAEATLGSAKASLAGKLSRAKAEASWRAVGRLAIAGFDPAPWWPGSSGGVLTRGSNRIDAKGDFDLLLAPAAGPSASLLDELRALRGKASLALASSTLAGVPLAGNASFTADGGPARLSFDVAAAGNRAQGKGRIESAGSADDWQLEVDAPSLAALAPLLPAGAGAAPTALAGSLQIKAQAGGRWPDVHSAGELHASALHYGHLQIAQADGHWRAGSTRNAALDGELVLAGIDQGGRKIAQARAVLSGTASAHRLEVRLLSAALPPEWVDLLGTEPALAAAVSASASASPLPAGSRSSVSFVAEGGLVDANGAAAAGWRGRAREVLAHSTAPPQRSWLQARDLAGSIFWAGGPLRVSMDAGSAQLLGAAIHWSRIEFQAADEQRGSKARLDLQASIDPLPVAPILRRLQPDFGWGGDLAVGARIEMHSAPAVTADVVFERARGDLTVTDEYGTEALGFSDMRLALAARDGVWRATAALAGTGLGNASAAVTARTGSGTAWPDAATPIEGVLELRVAQLGSWGRWVPAGWRVGGNLHASARVGGRLGAPEYTGHVEGANLGVRNFVEGVNITDGTVEIALQGETARIERFTAKAGKGSVRLEGGAVLGSAPTASIRLVAENFELLGRVDRRIVASGSAALRLDARTLGLDGSFKVDEGLIDFTRSDAPALGADVEVVRRPAVPPAATTVAAGSAPLPVAAAASAPATAASAAPAPSSRQVALDLRVALGDQLRIRGRGIDAGLRGELHLTSPNNRLAVNGTLSTVNGTYQAYGQKLGIDRGVLVFTGAVENPRLDIEATRPNIDVRAGVIVSGSAQSPRIRLFSEPEMSDLDKLSWLVLGRASDSTGGRADTALLQQAALALLSGEGPGVTDRLTKAIGLDSISLRQQTEGETKETIVSLGKQISKRWYVGYERGLNATTGNWQLIYRLAQRITVRAQAGSDSAVDLIWTLRWK